MEPIKQEKNSYLFGICQWITQQPEYKEREVTDSHSLFYHTAPLCFAEFIYRYTTELRAENTRLKEALGSIVFQLKLGHGISFKVLNEAEELLNPKPL
jgi:hypothetical protein